MEKKTIAGSTQRELLISALFIVLAFTFASAFAPFVY